MITDDISMMVQSNETINNYVTWCSILQVESFRSLPSGTLSLKETCNNRGVTTLIDVRRSQVD